MVPSKPLGLGPVGHRQREMVLAVGLGATGFVVNMLELQLGWGLHFMFGNALVFAFVRVLRPQWFVLAASISSLRSVFLWNHPWAWLIWTLEAGVVARYARRDASPVRADVIFWLLLGAPLLVLSYGLVMEMDRLSLFLVIAKQATNGVLSVVLGEMVYLAMLSLKALANRADWPKMPIESFLMTLLLAIILIPTTVYLYIDAPAREESARTKVDDALREQLQVTGKTLGMWVQSRALVLDMFAQKQLAPGGSSPGKLPQSLFAEFAQVDIIAADGEVLLGSGRSGLRGEVLRELASQRPAEQGGARLVALDAGQDQAPRQLFVVVSGSIAARPLAIIARLRPGVLPGLTHNLAGGSLEATFLVHPGAGFLPLSQSDPAILGKVRGLSAEQRALAREGAILVSSVAYGNALMSDLRDARMVRADGIAGLPDWQVLAVASLAPEVLDGRKGQLELFSALCAFVLLVTLIAAIMSRRTGHALRQLAQSAADLAMLGTKRDKIDSLVIAELNDISSKIASASSTVSRERGTLAGYQRRLDSIARHAPIIVYALDLRGHEKGDLVYVSEAIKAILGYSRDEAAMGGWWSHAIHPEDYERCTSLFAALQAGKVVHAEYRLRHKLGHYVWVYDTLSVEEGGVEDHFEAVGVLIDISERKVAAEQLLQADKMASLGRMIAGTAHELNQPLNFIKMAAANLREHARRGQMDPERFIARLDNILGHVGRASAIILQMRIFGRTPKEEPFPMDVEAAVEAVLAMVAPQFELDGTKVETSWSPEPARVRALPVLLEQVLLNLLLNANDAIRARHRTGNLLDGRIRVDVTCREGLVLITVEDNGTGLSPETLPVIFEPFFTTKAPKEGTGLGLPISYGIIRDLGGTISAQNSEQGARFTIELPQALA